MKHLLDSLPAKPPEFDTLVHLGAGPVFDAELYAALPARRYLLVEADPDSAADLQRAAPKPFEVLEKLVAPAPGPHPFRRFSLPALNGLLGLGAWQTIYPRAHEIAQLRLAAVNPAQLLTDLALSSKGKHALVLGLPGLETDLLSALFTDTPLPFDWIFLTGAAPPLMDQAKPMSEALQLVGKHHFQVKAQDDHSDPLQPVAFLQRDRRALELQSLRQDRETRTKERDALRAKLTALESEHSELATRHQQLATAFTALENKHSSLVTERDDLAKEKQSLANKVAELEKSRQELSAARDNAAKERDALKKTASDRATRIAELEAQLTDQAERQKQIDEEMAQTEGQLTMLKDLLRPALT